MEARLDVFSLSGSFRTKWAAIGILLVLCALAASGPTEARADSPCTDVEIVGLRGSSEEALGSEHDMGSLLGPVADTIVTQLSGSVTFSVYGIPYPAADAITGVLTGDYFTSKEIGSEMLEDYLYARASLCPATKFVVMGYSQGAHAAGDQLADAGSYITDRIAALVMFGDPRFNPQASYVWGSFDPRDHGLAGARSLSDFDGWSNRVFSFCRHNDLVCQGFGWGHTTGEHDQQKYIDDYADLVAGLVRRRLGLTQLPRIPLDLAFVIDSTGSMWSSIDEVREGVSSMVDKLEENESDYRIGLVDYKDTDQGDPYASNLDLDLTPDVPSFRSALAGISAYGGGDYPEAVFSGLMTAFRDLSWRSGSRKAVILMGDAPGKDPEPITGYTHESVLTAAHSLSPVAPAAFSRNGAISAATSGEEDSAVIYPLAVGGGPLETFEPLADGTGGKVFFASGSSEVGEEILAAVDNAAAPVEVALSSVAPARPGEPVVFDAAAAYAGGDIAEYAWDFDGDGWIDQTTTTGHVSHVYEFPFEGFAEVTAISEDGHEGSAVSPVVISEDAPVMAAAPRNLTLHSSPTSLEVTWEPPMDLGGGALAGYQVEVENLDTHQVKLAGGLDAETERMALGDLTSGTYRATVAAVTDAGPGVAAIDSAFVGASPPPPAPSFTPPPSPPASRTAGGAASATRKSRLHRKCKEGQRVRKAHGKVKCLKPKHRRHKSRR